MRSLSVSSGPVARSFLQQCQLTLESDLFPKLWIALACRANRRLT